MQNYTIHQRIQIVKIHYQNGSCFAETIRKCRTAFGHRNAPCRNTVVNLIKKFELSGSVGNEKSCGHIRTSRTTEMIASVSQSVQKDGFTSIAIRSQQIGISKSSLQRILKEDLHLHAYKIQLAQELKPQDHESRREFASWVLKHEQHDEGFSKKIIFSDEAHFYLSGHVNRQNCRIWGSENPKAIYGLPMYPERVTVWCGFWAGGLIGPYFFENESGKAVTVNGIRYREMITNFLWHEIGDMDVDGIWFQQDGATCHSAKETLQLLRTKFNGRLISKRGDVNWPPRSCDLTPLDYFLWGYLKDKVYVSKPQTIHELKEEIRNRMAEISKDQCQNVIENFIKRVNLCLHGQGTHLSDVLFHK